MAVRSTTKKYLVTLHGFVDYRISRTFSIHSPTLNRNQILQKLRTTVRDSVEVKTNLEQFLKKNIFPPRSKILKMGNILKSSRYPHTFQLKITLTSRSSIGSLRDYIDSHVYQNEFDFDSMTNRDYIIPVFLVFDRVVTIRQQLLGQMHKSNSSSPKSQKRVPTKQMIKQCCKENPTCPICLEDVVGRKVTALIHETGVFHCICQSCLNEMRKHRGPKTFFKCPLCRQETYWGDINTKTFSFVCPSSQKKKKSQSTQKRSAQRRRKIYMAKRQRMLK